MFVLIAFYGAWVSFCGFTLPGPFLVSESIRNKNESKALSLIVDFGDSYFYLFYGSFVSQDKSTETTEALLKTI